MKHRLITFFLAALATISSQASAQFNLLDTLKKGADALQSLNSATQQPKNDAGTNKPSQATTSAPATPIAKSGGTVTNENIKDVLIQFDKKYNSFWKSDDELKLIVNVEISKNGADKFYTFKVTNPAQVPKGYRQISITCDVPQHFDQAIESLKVPPKSIQLLSLDWRSGPFDTESAEARRKPTYYLEAGCDFELLSK